MDDDQRGFKTSRKQATGRSIRVESRRVYDIRRTYRVAHASHVTFQGDIKELSTSILRTNGRLVCCKLCASSSGTICGTFWRSGCCGILLASKRGKSTAK